ncbi:MAG: hypothetical protein CR982_06030 [Candidatus Cloacimonadota bacterium]|nr:MAG: hypothetical protein CR982_06030 [Candidatus Cloacimonadota bacterium]PIE78078.1 MAG: hypothetical protein CSA15_09590 [Candidatus Delongbacteria bacterium]
MCYRIVLIEDDDLVRLGIKKYLEKLDYTVFEADSGEKGIELVKSENPDLIILDLILPNVGGFEFLKIAKESNFNIPVIVISGTGLIDDVVKAHKLGAWEFIEKPILNYKVLSLSIDSVMKRYNLEKQNRLYNENLKKLVDERTEKIKEQNIELKKTIESLQLSRERSKSFSENSLDGLIFIEDGKIIDYNKRFLEIFRIDDVENDCLDIEELFVESMIDDVVTPCTDENKTIIEVDAISTNGVIFPVEIHKKEITRKNRKVLSVAIRDITKQKSIERESLTLSNYFENVLNSLPFIVLGCDRYGNIIFANNTTEYILEKDINSIINTKIEHTLSFVPEVKEKLFEVFDRNKEIYIPRLNVEYLNISYIDLSIVPISTPSGAQAIVKISDITELENRESQFRQAQKMETIGNLAGGLAHDFNNVLGGISGSASLLRYKFKPEGVFKEYLDVIESSVSRAADMVKQLLTLSQRQELSFAPTDINLSLKHVLKLCGNSFDKSIIIDFIRSDEDPVVCADPTQLEQVFLNICINASHAMTIMRGDTDEYGGDLCVTIRSFDPNTSFLQKFSNVDPKKSFWEVEISDTGVGIPSENLKKLYEPFFTTKDKEHGTGLGLAMVYNIVSLHGGYLDVETEVGKGSKFHVYLPKKLNQSSSASKEFAVFDHIYGEGTILLIDDEKVIRKVAKDMLEQFGYKVETASNGLEGVKVFKSSGIEFVAVILNINMPKQAGEETFNQIKELDPEIPIFIASGYKKNHIIERLIKSGAAGFIQKPYTIVGLSNLLKKSINN